MHRAVITTALTSALALSAAVGCNNIIEPTNPGAIVRSIGVEAMMPGMFLNATNLAFDDVDREILVLDDANGVVVLNEDGTTNRRYDLSPIGGNYTAIAAIPGTNDVLLTSPWDWMGYRVDLSTMTVVTTFCLLPGEIEEWEQRNFALAYDEGSDLIYAVPQTWIAGSFETSRLEIYNGTTGEAVMFRELGALPVEAIHIDPTSGAVNLISDGVVLLWQDDEVSGVTTEVRALSAEIGADVASFAYDRIAGTHYVLDPATARVLEVNQ